MYLTTNRQLRLAVALTLGPLTFIACKQDAPTELTKPRIVNFAGNLQEGFVDTKLPVAFTVKVVDPSNRPMPNMAVDWRVTSGAGDLLNVDDNAPFTVTDASGRAAAIFRPTSLGASIVTVSASALPGATVRFDVSARRKPDVVIQIVPGFFDCFGPSTFVGPDSSSNVVVPVGAVVEWVYAELWMPDPFCAARLRSTAVPPGGVSFDEPLAVRAHFQLVANVVGRWVFVDGLNGGGGTLTAHAP